jgi:hypothetical protein
MVHSVFRDSFYPAKLGIQFHQPNPKKSMVLDTLPPVNVSMDFHGVFPVFPRVAKELQRGPSEKVSHATREKKLLGGRLHAGYN